MTETSHTCRAMSVCRSVRRCDTKCCDMLQSVAAYTKPKKITLTRAEGVMSHMNNVWHIWMSVCACVCMCACMKPKKNHPQNISKAADLGFLGTLLSEIHPRYRMLFREILPEIERKLVIRRARKGCGHEVSYAEYGTESCRILHVGLSHAAHGTASCCTWDWVMSRMRVSSHVCMRHGDESCHICMSRHGGKDYGHELSHVEHGIRPVVHGTRSCWTWNSVSASCRVCMRHVALWKEGLWSRSESCWTWDSSCCTWDQVVSHMRASDRVCMRHGESCHICMKNVVVLEEGLWSRTESCWTWDSSCCTWD